MKFLESLMEFFYWCVIFICPTAILSIIGFVINYNYKGDIGFFSFIGLSILGVALGIYFAEKIRRSVGCTYFITRTTPWDDSKKDENSN